MKTQNSTQNEPKPKPEAPVAAAPFSSEAKPSPFCLQDAALLANISIEASAGTGKTYALEQIVCHLLEQHGLNIKQILLLTYTEKAASELRERIRSKLSQRFTELKNSSSHETDEAREEAKNRILRALNQFNEASISTIHSFFQRCLELYPLEVGRPLAGAVTGASAGAPIDPSGNPVRELVLDELQAYDEELKNCLLKTGELAVLDSSGQLASQKILEYCGSSELQNFWNMHPHFSLYPGQDELQAFQALEQEFASGQGKVFDALVQLAQCDWSEDIFANRSSAKKLKNLPKSYTPEIAVAFFAHLKELLDLPPAKRFQALCELLQTRPPKRKANKAKSDADRVESPYLVLLQCLHPERLEEANSNFALPIGEWAHYEKALAVQDFLEAFPAYLDFVHSSSTQMIQASFLAQFLFAMRSKIYPKLQAAKSLQGTRSFNDMIEDLYKVVVLKQAGEPETLLSLIQSQYRTILIDEFQDTDPVQWQIIFELFGQGKPQPLPQSLQKEPTESKEKAEHTSGNLFEAHEAFEAPAHDSASQMLVRKHNFIIVGDPKQSIYVFRGVNRQLYQQVQNICDFHYRLGDNYRSNASLVGACNQVFQRIWPDRFIFEPVSAADGAAPPLLLEGGEAAPAFTFLDCDPSSEDADADKVSHVVLRERGIEAITQKIQVLLRAGEILRPADRRKLRAEDIAVLVRQKADGHALQARLVQLGVAAQFREERSVFADPSAQALQYFLLALCQPRELEHSVRLLLSHFFGLEVPEVKWLLWNEGSGASGAASGQEAGVLEHSEFALAWIEKLMAWKLQVDMGQLQSVLEDLFQYGNELQKALQEAAPKGAQEATERDASSLRQDLLCRILSGAATSRGQSDLESYNNLRHLMEILNSEQLASALDCRDLAKFLSQQIEASDAGDDAEVYKQRSLETEAVQIMTIHASKGLEFPVVFLSFGLNQMKDARLYVRGEFCHVSQVGSKRARGVYRQRAYLVSKGEQAFWQESCAELRRLLYVALTRASAKLYFPFHSSYPKSNKVPYRSILEEMLGLAQAKLKPFLNGEDTLFLNLTQGFKDDDYAQSVEVRSELESLVASFPQSFSLESALLDSAPLDPTLLETAPLEKHALLESAPLESGASEVRAGAFGAGGCRELKQDNLQYRFPAVSSFSSLQRSIEGRPHEFIERVESSEAETVFDASADKERDAESLVSSATLTASSALTAGEQGQEWHELWLSPGAGLGNLLHNILETCGYEWIASLSLQDLLESELWYENLSLQSRGHFPRDWARRAYPALCRMVWYTLHRDLAGSAGLSGSLRLCDLGLEQRRHEVEFLLHIPQHSSLQAEQFLLGMSGKVEVSKGFLKGFIDLLFVHAGQVFLLDWKSNIQYKLLADTGDLEQIRRQLYSPDALRGLMEEHFYTMQYLIYLSVVYYYLRMQYGSAFVYEQHFGGCYYLFLRGSSANERDDAGVFFHKPEEAVVLAILQQLGLVV